MRERPCALTRLIYALKLARARPLDRNDRHDSHAPHLHSTVTYNTEGHALCGGPHGAGSSKAPSYISERLRAVRTNATAGVPAAERGLSLMEDPDGIWSIRAVFK